VQGRAVVLERAVAEYGAEAHVRTEERRGYDDNGRSVARDLVKLSRGQANTPRKIASQFRSALAKRGRAVDGVGNDLQQRPASSVIL
jgi:hypothetical protein